MARQAGKKNRNYPPLPLARALEVVHAIADEASGMTVSRLTLAELLDTTPTSSALRALVAASRFYGLTTGGINAQEFSLTALGERAAGEASDERSSALKSAVMNVEPYKTFFETFKGKKIPGDRPLREFLVRDAEIQEERVEEVITFILEDARTTGLLRRVKGSDYVDFEGVPEVRTDADGDGYAAPEALEDALEEDRRPEEPEDEDGGPPGRRPARDLLALGRMTITN